jgi:large subunit ribosomal protein LX
MKAYRVVGSFRQGKKDQEFSMDLVAEDEAGAKEKIMSNFGSRHGAKRRQITIETIETIKPADSIAPAVISHFRDN